MAWDEDMVKEQRKGRSKKRAKASKRKKMESSDSEESSEGPSSCRAIPMGESSTERESDHSGEQAAPAGEVEVERVKSVTAMNEGTRRSLEGRGVRYGYYSRRHVPA